VEKQMPEAARVVQECVGEDLPGPEPAAVQGPECEHLLEQAAQDELEAEDSDVDQEQCPSHWRQRQHAYWFVVGCGAGGRRGVGVGRATRECVIDAAESGGPCGPPRASGLTQSMARQP